MMGNMMNFAAYLFMGIPAGNLLVKIGYKKTALWALAVGIVGLFVQFLSSSVGTDTVVTTFNSTNADGVAHFFPDHPQLLHLSARRIHMRFLRLHAQHGCLPDAPTFSAAAATRANQLLQSGGALNSFSGTMTPSSSVCSSAFSPTRPRSEMSIRFFHRYRHLCGGFRDPVIRRYT